MKILDKLKNECVFRIDFEGKAFVVTEMCDGYFTTTLTINEVHQLGEELIALVSLYDTGKVGA